MASTPEHEGSRLEAEMDRKTSREDRRQLSSEVGEEPREQAVEMERVQKEAAEERKEGGYQ